MAEILGHGTGDSVAGKGGDRARHRDGAGADRRRRTRYRPVARADGSGVDRRQPQRGRHLGQPLDPAIGPCVASCLRQVRRIFLQQAAERLGVDIDALDIEDGTISGPGNVRTSYWELAEEVSLDRDATPDARPKTATERALAGNSIPRVDIPDKVFARARFIHDQALPGMLHGRVLRPENARAKLRELKEDGARTIAGLVAVVRDGSFAGVVSETEHGAELALQALGKGATWSDGEALPDENDLASF